MKNHIARFCIIFSLFACLSNGYSQKNLSDKEKITKSIEEYFFFERENIHIQFNKSVYLSNEKVWFKGYVYHRKEKLPFFTTTNVYATLYDENGTKLMDKLFYANNGTFSGDFNLDDSFKTGKYYVQIFTNWMMNFKEDESSIFKIDIINKEEKTTTIQNKPNYSKINIAFSPEGGKIIEGTSNNIGLKITDCNEKPLPISEVELIDSEGKPVQKIKINKLGFGKFLLAPNYKNYKITVTVNDKKTEEIIPEPSTEGLALEANAYSFNDKTVIKIRTNSKNIERLSDKKLYLIVQQDNKSVVFDIDFSNKNPEQTLVFSNENLHEGVNTIRIIDTEMKQLAERFIFKYPKDFLSINLDTPRKEKDSITFSGRLNYPNNNISISVLPEESISINNDNDIYGSFLINPYLNDIQIDAKYYFNEISKTKSYELDLFLLNQKSGKYKWENIISSPPKNTYGFDFGLTLKTTINQTLADRKKHKMQLFSLESSINEFADVNEKNESFFDNLILADSTGVNFTLVKDLNKSIPLKIYPQILNGRRIFNKPFQPKKIFCEATEDKVEYEMPNFSTEVVMLDDVEIEVKKKKKLQYENVLGNGNLRGYKIDGDDDNKFMDVLNFIRNNGFDVPTTSTSNSVQIFSRTVNSINAARSTPIVYIDGIQQLSFDMLLNMKMSEINEIYINAHAIVPSVRNNLGVIKIYRKIGGNNSSLKSESIPFEIKNAFSKIEKFKNSNYTSTENKGFKNFGVIHWIPSILTQDNGNFKFQIPNMNQKSVKIVIEGFSADGKLISEIRTISLPQ